MMQLYFSGNSPYARRTRLVVRALGLDDRVEEIAITDFAALAKIAPGAKVPVLVTDEGRVLCESLVITRYLNEIGGGGLLPADHGALAACLEVESTASVLMDSLFVHSMEVNQRPSELRSTALLERENARRARCYDRLEALSAGIGSEVTLASIAVVAALGYADWRAPDDSWREGRAGLAALYDGFMEQPAFQDTAPVF